jgi:hypothetical protein
MDVVPEGVLWKGVNGFGPGDDGWGSEWSQDSSVSADGQSGEQSDLKIKNGLLKGSYWSYFNYSTLRTAILCV